MPTVKLSPVFNDQTFTSAGLPASGYQLFTYAVGSSTKQTTYSDSAGTTPQANPIILNSSGYPTAGPIWLTSGLTYKFVLALSTDTDPPASPVKTIDGVTGVNDTSSTVSQWVSSGVTPTYIGATSFSLVGDQTTEFHVGRRIQATVSAGTVYGVITVSAYTTLTTVTVVLDSGVLDSGLSAINLSILRNDNLAIPNGVASAVQIQTARRFTAGGTADAITGTLSPAITSYAAGLRVTTTVAANTIVAPTMNLNGLGVKTIKKRGAAAKVALCTGDYTAYGPMELEYDGTDFVLLNPSASGEAGKVIQVQSFAIDAGSSTTSTTFANTSASAKVFTPKSTNSTLVVMVSAEGIIAAAGAGVNSVGTAQIYDGTSLVGNTPTVGVVSGGGANLQTQGSVVCTAVLANTVLTARSFVLHGKTSTAAAAYNLLNQIFIITEVAN